MTNPRLTNNEVKTFVIRSSIAQDKVLIVVICWWLLTLWVWFSLESVRLSSRPKPWLLESSDPFFLCTMLYLSCC